MALETELAYLESHRNELLRQYGPKFMVIHGEEVCAAGDTISDALEQAATIYGTQNVLIRQAAEASLVISAPAYALGILQTNPSVNPSH